MNLIQWATSPWGQQVPIHISWTLLWVSAIGGLLFLIVHALYVSIWAKPAAAHSAASAASGAAAARIPERVPRHNLSARLFHAIMALAMLALLFTAFLPKVGVKFPWVTYHWIAGIVLSISVVYHIFDAFLGLDFWSIWPDKVDIEDAGRRMKRAMGQAAPEPRKFAKYPLENKLYHLVVMLAGLAVIGTGLFMMKRVRTPLLHSQSISLQRHDLGLDVRAARPRGRRICRARHGAHLHGDPAGKILHHQVDDLRLDEPRKATWNTTTRNRWPVAEQVPAAARPESKKAPA